MDPQRWQRLQQLFEQAVPLDHDARVRFLAVECADDPGLESEVLALLQAHDRDSQVEQRIEDDIGSTLQAPDLAVGQIIGRFKVTRLLGRGGMGSVYLAERADEQFRQNVALKIVSRGLLQGELLLRFRAERQILARLNHPNIARLIDGGQMPDGTPFIVMEYVEGLRIDRYCDQQQLSTHARLRLVQQVCAAVNYAHQHLIIHRDLKPANILVTKDGVPKLLDFGIAKLLDDEGRADTESPVTQFRERVLTPEHASPEQLRGEPVGTASDVYGLGVLIYELLTGRHPYRFANRSLYEIERAVREQGPLAPSAGVRADARAAGSPQLRSLARELAGDLDNIVLKAMSHQPERRYASAAALAQDIQNYLERRPVLARPDTWAYRTRKFIRRNTFAVASAASVTLLIVALVTFSVIRITAERDSAERAQQTAERERQTAERVSQFMIDAFRLANPNELPGKQITAQEVLDAAARNLDENLTDEPRVRLASMRTIGETYLGMGLRDQAHAMLTRTVAQIRAEPRVSRLDLARALAALGSTAIVMGRQNEAERAFDEALAIRVSMNQEQTNEGILLLCSIADSRRDKEKFAEALQVHGRAEQLAKALSPPDPVLLGRVYSAYATTYHVMNEAHKAEEYARRSLPLLKDVAGSGSDYYGDSLDALGIALLQQSRYEDAAEVFRQLLDRQLHRYGPDHFRVGHTWANYGMAVSHREKTEEAEKALLEALRILRQSPRDDEATIATLYKNLSWLYSGMSELQKALEAADAGIEILRRLKGTYAKELVSSLNMKSGLLQRLRQLDKAEETFAEAEKIQNEKLAGDDRLRGQLLQSRGSLRLARGDLQGAQRALQEAKHVFEKQEGAGLEGLAGATFSLGRLALQSNQLDQARVEFSAALAILRKIYPAGNHQIVFAESYLGEALCLSGDRAQGLAMMSQAVARMRATFPEDRHTHEAEKRLQNACKTP